MCNADAWDHGGVAEDDWGAGEVVEESNSGAEKNRCDVDVDFVEESSVEALLDGVGAVDSNGLPASCSFGLVDSGFDTVGDEVHSRVGRCHPSGMWWVSTNAGPQAWFPPHPWALSKVRRPVSMAPSSDMRP